MPTQQQIQDTILSGQLQMANLALTNANQLKVGNNAIKFAPIRQFNKYINVLSFQYRIEDYTSSTTLSIYNCLTMLIGIDVITNTIDPNYQAPGTTINIINPASYLAPMDINWSNFSTDGSPDSGTSRNTYYNAELKGLNPFMQLSTVELVLGLDYTLIPSGGFILNSSGNMPFIYQGQFLRAYSYQLA